MTFYRNEADKRNEDWGFNNQDIRNNGTPVKVTSLRLATWLRDEILDRKMPDTVYGEYQAGPKVVMKLDIEGSEYSVLPDLMFSGLLCQNIDFLFMEVHDWPVDHEADPLSGRGELHLQRGQSAQFLREGIAMLHSVKDCATRIAELDDEAYLHDGMPFPSES